jgi:hypothetical protein
MRVQVRFDMPDTLEDGRRPSLSLTARTQHFVLGLDWLSYRVVNDGGEPALYLKFLFDVIDAAIPPGWEFDEGDEGTYYLDPIVTSRPGFYEHFFGSNPDRPAQLAAQQTVRDVLSAAMEAFPGDRALIERELARLRRDD